MRKYYLFPRRKKGVEGAANGKKQPMYSVLMSDDTVCAGYAQAFGAMANAMGIDSYIELSDSHAWNAARFGDGNYYFVDVCWNDLDNEKVCDEGFIGVREDYALYRDNGTRAHVLNGKSTAYGPSIPKEDYKGDSSAEISAPSLRVGGSGSSLVKVEWDAVPGAQKYEYSVFDSVATYVSKNVTEENFIHVSIPDRAGSMEVKVRAVTSENGRNDYSQYSQITVSPDGSGDKPDKPANVRTERTEQSFRVLWDKNSDYEWQFICYGEDATLTKIWQDYATEYNAVGWVSWLPEKDNYFAVMSVKRSGNTEIYSDPVYFKYNINDGLRLINDNASSGSSGGSGGEIVTKVYSTGTYVGEMKDGKLDGHGKMTWTNGNIYEGEWKDSAYNGQGKLTYPDGTVHEGEFKDGRGNGQGKVTYTNGNVDEGEYKDGNLISGKKTLNLGNGVYIYESNNFINGKMNGQSTRTIYFSNGDVYILSGVYANDELTQGKLDYSWGDNTTATKYVYEGGLENGSPNGQGTYTLYYFDGVVMVRAGEFKSDFYNGSETVYNADGSVRYTYTYKNGEKI